MTLRLLGIDPGTFCGWALRQPDGRYSSGVWQLKPGWQESPGRRFTKLTEYLTSLDSRQPIGLVAYEEVRHHAGVQAAHIYGGLVATIQAWCCEHGVEHRGVAVATVKRHATGKGVATKDAMIKAAMARWPDQRIDDDNQADALWIAEAAAAGIPTAPPRRPAES